MYQKCGANQRCDANSTYPFVCKCLPGYEPKSIKDWDIGDGLGGWKRLNSSLICGHGEGFTKVKSVKLLDSPTAVRVHMSTNPMECERK